MTSNIHKTILLVDYDENIHQLYKQEFNEAFGEKVELLHSYDGKSAFESFKENSDKLALVISNMRLPDIDGTALLKMCKDFRPNIPFIFNTSYDYMNIDDFPEPKPDAYIVWSSDLTELLNTISRLLGLKRDIKDKEKPGTLMENHGVTATDNEPRKKVRSQHQSIERYTENLLPGDAVKIKQIASWTIHFSQSKQAFYIQTIDYQPGALQLSKDDLLDIVNILKESNS